MEKILSPHYLILGAHSKTGRSLARYVSQKGFRYSLSDITPNFFQDYQEEALLPTPPIQVFDDKEQDFDQLNSIDIIVFSPGIPSYHPLLQEARRRSIIVDGEIAFCCKILEKEERLPFLLGITGSLGKSTTSFLTYKLLKEGLPEKNIFLLGNFGTPFSSHLDLLQKQDVVVLELSSYQLEDAEKYRINGATLLNVTPNHLDRYDSLKDYQKAKEKIFERQSPEDFSIFNKSRRELEEVASHIVSRKIFVNSSYDPNSSYSFDSEGNIYNKDRLFLQNSSLTLKNPHILEDMCTALAFSSAIDVSSSVQKDILSSFTGLEHRSEWVIKLKDIQFINDSKATTPFAVIPNLQDHSYGKLTLILGGKNKDLDFSILSPYLQNVQAIVYYGKDGRDIQKSLSFSPSEYTYNFSDAVQIAHHMAKKFHSQTVLLSPGCTSFDQFDSYEQRGQVFKNLVRNL